MMSLASHPVVPLIMAPFLGSFLGTLVARLPAGRSVISGRSECDACHATLGSGDLIPIVSWICSLGRCRFCRTAIGVNYLLVELAALAVAVWASAETSGARLWATCALGWVLLALMMIDWKHFLLPDVLTLPLLAAGFGVTYWIEPESIIAHVIGAAGGYGCMRLVAVAYRFFRGRDGLGQGDAKLMAAAGAWMGWEALPSVLTIGCILALSGVLAGTLVGRPVQLEQRIPFGTYLAAGFWLIWLYGPLGTG